MHTTLIEVNMITVKYEEYEDLKSGATKISTDCKIYENVKVGSITCRFDHACSGKVDLENKTVECHHPSMS